MRLKVHTKKSGKKRSTRNLKKNMSEKKERKKGLEKECETSTTKWFSDGGVDLGLVIFVRSYFLFMIVRVYLLFCSECPLFVSVVEEETLFLSSVLTIFNF